jgi:hypothetical protein
MPAAQRDMVLLRQSLLTAHELGHVMGFGHNFASSVNDRASVMEYPTPRVKVVNGRLDLSEAFERRTGLYDDLMSRYAYTEFPAGKEEAGLKAIIAEMRAKNILFVPSLGRSCSRSTARRSCRPVNPLARSATCACG